MDQHQIEIITVNGRNSAEIEKPAGAAVGDASDAQEVQSGERNTGMTYLEEEIRTLAKLKGLEPTKINLWKVAVEEYSNRRTMFENRIYKTEEKICSVKNELYQVVGFFSAFQGLLITAAAQSNLLRCNNVGFILALSAFATAVAVFGIGQKNRTMTDLRTVTNNCTLFMKAYFRMVHLLKRVEINFDFNVLQDLGHVDNNPHPQWKKILVSPVIWLVVSVIAFGGLCMLAMRQILCNPGHSLPSN
ncbi:hypothetical protein CY35_13G108200 [Sphagnum magellanicum]|nr:hypothetical protein CY35_13G108200 [Sphagnum magellanicum]